MHNAAGSATVAARAIATPVVDLAVLREQEAPGSNPGIPTRSAGHGPRGPWADVSRCASRAPLPPGMYTIWGCLIRS